MISEAPFLKREQRRTPRFTFIASAELIEQKTDVRIATRVSELSLHGCYLDMMNPFPQDTFVLVKIFAGEDCFQAKAKIVYVQPNLGAGLAFLEVEPQKLSVLQRWLDDAQKDGQKRSG
jgi:PilZ domain